VISTIGIVVEQVLAKIRDRLGIEEQENLRTGQWQTAPNLDPVSLKRTTAFGGAAHQITGSTTVSKILIPNKDLSDEALALQLFLPGR
jgi:hypothetical protein